MPSKKIKIYFTDFSAGFDEYDNYFTQILAPHFNIIIDANQPDFLIYSCFGIKFLSYNCLKIFYTGENLRPDFRDCDFALSFDYIKHPRHFRLPLYLCHLVEQNLRITSPKNVEQIIPQKTKFCSFLFSNAAAYQRVKFFKALSTYKKIDAGGKLMNNIGYRPVNGLAFLKPYKFNICFENSSYPGYTTEKIVNAMVANCIPIYWGDPLIHKAFNPKSFINIHDYPSFQDAIEHIIEIDSNETLYRSYLSEPFVTEDAAIFFKEQEVINFFTAIFNQAHFKPTHKFNYFMGLLRQIPKLLKLWKYLWYGRLRTALILFFDKKNNV